MFAAGHAEAGNDIPVLMSTCQAERVAGGYRLTGRKQFGSNGPAWRWLGAHAIDVTAPGGPQIVHAFVERKSAGVTVVETWDTLGMRPTQSHDTILDGVFVPDERIGRVVPAGDGSDPFLVAMAMWPLSLIAAVYLGIADRALEVAVVGARRKTSVAIPRGAYAYNPFVQHQVADMYLELDAASATHERFVADWVAGADHGEGWVPKVYAMKWRAVEAAKRVVDIALDVAGGAGMMVGNELERLYRDVRCGGFHPGNDALTHELVGKAVLGILHEQPALVTHSARRACSTAASPSSTRPVGAPPHRHRRRARRAAAPPSSVSATSSAPKMRCPAAVARTAPSRTAASWKRPSRASSPAIERSIVHCVDHIPARRQCMISRR